MEHRQIDKDDTEMEPFQNLPETFTIIDEIVSRVFGKGPERVPEGGPVGVGRGGTAEQLRHVMWSGMGEPRGTRKVLPGRRPGGTRAGNPKLHCFIHPSVHSFIHSPIHPVSLLAHGLQEAQQSHLPRHLCNRSWRVVRY
jgi:hypothetical protein